jgi:LacI family transcriptional regulator
MNLTKHEDSEMPHRSRRKDGYSGLPLAAASPSRRATLQDVAKDAGVSVSAVSKVVRGASGVSAHMLETVTSSIERLGYRPHAGARGLRGRSFTVGVMIVDLLSPFQPEVVQGISAELESSPYQEVVVVGGISPDRQRRCIEALVDRQVDGLILVAPWMEVGWIEELAGSTPTVVVGLHGAASNFDTVVDDDREGARLMVEHLVSLGHRHIVHTSAPSGGKKKPFVLSHTARREGYELAMKAHGLDPDVVVTMYTEEGGYRAATEIMSRDALPTAIFAGADIAAFGVLRALEDKGIRVPEDITITGYDNIYASTIGRIALTTVDQSGFLTGSVSAKLLLERLNGRGQPVQYVVGPKLITRSTSAEPRSNAQSRAGAR